MSTLDDDDRRRGGSAADDESPRGSDPEQDRWNYAARQETPQQALDRNLNELLQELRVTQTGVQLLFAFLLTLAFTERFSVLDDWQRTIYLATLITATGSAALFIAPVAYHRAVFRRRMKERVVQMSHLFATGGLLLLAIAMSGAVLLVTSVVVPTGWALGITGVVATWFAVLWVALPLLHGRWRANGDAGADGRGGTRARTEPDEDT